MNPMKTLMALMVVVAASASLFLSSGCGGPDNQTVTNTLPAVTTNTVFTCPMHPEVVSNAPGDCPKCGMHLVPKP